MKKRISILLAMLLLMESLAVAAVEHVGMSNFQRVNTYTDGQFGDVAPEDWYSASVGTAYALGLMCGESEDYFNAGGTVTQAQTVAMAARLHSIYHTGKDSFPAGEPWYAPYVRYAEENGILVGTLDPDAAAARAQFADLLSRALPEEALAPINEIDENTIPDVKTGDVYAESIYELYRAGIVTGSGERGAFQPERSITRAEAAVIITRMADESLRQSFTLRYAGPDLTEQEEMDDSFFENAAILGNSLVEGLRMYSDMHSLQYFSAKSVSVYSAMHTKDAQMHDGTYGTLVQALCQEQHDKIYIELGTNELGNEVDYFIERYADMLDTIMEAEPEAEIYILSVMPITKHKSESNSVYNMDRVKLYNEALYQLADEKQVHYMDLCSAFVGEDGYLPWDYSGDGIHIHAPYYEIWEHCMRTLY